MKTIFCIIIALNTFFKYIDWLLLLIGIYLFAYSSNGSLFESILSTIIGFFIVLWLGRFLASLLVLIASIPLFITTFLTNYFLERYNDDNLKNDLTMFHFVMIAFSMVCYGVICTWIFLSKNYSTQQDFYFGLLFLYIAIMYPAMMIIEIPEDHALDIFGAMWTFFYRISFIIGLIAVAFLNTNIYSVFIIAIVGMSIPINMLYACSKQTRSTNYEN